MKLSGVFGKGFFPSKTMAIMNSFFRCLMHVINLAAQALIKVYSSTKHYDPQDPEAHAPSATDEIGKVHAITVKVHYV